MKNSHRSSTLNTVNQKLLQPATFTARNVYEWQNLNVVIQTFCHINFHESGLIVTFKNISGTKKVSVFSVKCGFNDFNSVLHIVSQITGLLERSEHQITLTIYKSPVIVQAINLNKKFQKEIYYIKGESIPKRESAYSQIITTFQSFLHFAFIVLNLVAQTILGFSRMVRMVKIE